MNITAQEVAERAKCTPLAADLVMNGSLFAKGVKGMGRVASMDVTAQELCDAVAETAKANYGPSLPATFTKAGILSSEDIGRIVFALVDQGILMKREGESIVDFDGLFETVRLK